MDQVLHVSVFFSILPCMLNLGAYLQQCSNNIPLMFLLNFMNLLFGIVLLLCDLCFQNHVMLFQHFCVQSCCCVMLFVSLVMLHVIAFDWFLKVQTYSYTIFFIFQAFNNYNLCVWTLKCIEFL